MIRQYELVERVKSYDPSADEDVLNRAYVYSMKRHGHQTRESGDPYFSHPLEVAGILTDYRLDSSSIATALLHDVVEDTDASLEDIEDQFGLEVRRLVDGVTKLSRIEVQSENTKHAENFRKLLLAMSEDIRVLLVKLADRLHNMRTLHHVRLPEKRLRISLETMEIYAPLAERIGMHHLKDELEDLAFTHINPDARTSIINRLHFLEERGEDVQGRIIEELGAALQAEGLRAEVSGRVKTPYSIWRKMQQKDTVLEQLSDIVAFRIVVDSIEDCYRTLGVLHGRYSVVPGRFKDYLSTPKPNGYRSLHTGLIGPERHRIEVQIRTREMHEIAEMGVAAHWRYKQGAERIDGRQYRWIRELLDILEHASDPEEFLEHTKLEMFQDQVFCFTPKGDLIALPRNATPVDFAYAVHSEVGDTCVGAKINGRIRQLSSNLHNGDQVEILTSKNSTPSPDWENFVVTGKARARIRRFVRMEERAQYQELGRQILLKVFRQEGVDLTEKGLEGVLKKFSSATVADLYTAVGSGFITGREVMVAVYPGLRQDAKPQTAVPTVRRHVRRPKVKEHAVPIKGLIPGMAVHFARCCHPLPGDRIVGIVTTGKGVTIHTIDCDTLESFAESPERWLDVAWQTGDDENVHVGRLHVVLANEPGSLGSVSTVIGKNGGNITNLRFTTRSSDFFEMLIDLNVKDVKHLTNIIAALRATPAINSVERARA